MEQSFLYGDELKKAYEELDLESTKQIVDFSKSLQKIKSREEFHTSL